MNDKVNLDELTPKAIVLELDKYIIGQNKAKRSVAIALRNRQRRLKLEESIRDEVAPKNILMIGPTGVGKTEIARRLAKLCSAPFIKVEATKYTEVGYVGRDVESMVRDLMSAAINLVTQEMKNEKKDEARKMTEERLLDLLLPGSGYSGTNIPDGSEPGLIIRDNSTREKFREMLRNGELEDRVVDIEVKKKQPSPMMEIFAGTNFEDFGANMANITGFFSPGKNRKEKKKVPVKDAREIILQDEAEKLIDNDSISEIARKRVENLGIIFIDEIDKIAAKNEGSSNHDVSREGVQRDILPIVEGSTVNTKYGPVDTTHILFIAAGAFNLSKPSDLIPELQGRFPLRVELDSLNAEDFRRILTEPKNALINQYKQLLATEDVSIVFEDSAIERMSEIAQESNQQMENIGARRLHTIMETLLEELSFNAPELKGQEIKITRNYVDERLGSIIENRDLSRYIL